MKRMWGDQFYNAKEKKWNKTGGDGYARGFCQLVLDPIFKVSYAASRLPLCASLLLTVSTLSRFLVPS